VYLKRIIDIRLRCFLEYHMLMVYSTIEWRDTTNNYMKIEISYQSKTRDIDAEAFVALIAHAIDGASLKLKEKKDNKNHLTELVFIIPNIVKSNSTVRIFCQIIYEALEDFGYQPIIGIA